VGEVRADAGWARRDRYQSALACVREVGGSTVKPKVTDHDYSQSSAAIADAQYYEAQPEFSVWSWSPAPAGTAHARSTQVHVHFGTPPGVVMVVRFKSADAIDALIDALVKHRTDVWGKR
jgi:hypothetical protein